MSDSRFQFLNKDDNNDFDSNNEQKEDDEDNNNNIINGIDNIDSYYPRSFFTPNNSYQIFNQFYPQNQIPFNYNLNPNFANFQFFSQNVPSEQKSKKKRTKNTFIPVSNVNMNINQINIIPNGYYHPEVSQSYSTVDDLVKETAKNGITLTQYIKTQRGSREVQKLLYKISPNDISTLIQLLSSTMNELMTDKYGNYFCQKLIQNCSPEQRIEILKSVKENFNEISCNCFGTHSLQVLVEIANMENEQELLGECIEKNLLNLSCDQRGTHIVQKFLSSCSNAKFQIKLHEIIINNFINLVNNPHGVCVLIKLLKYSTCTEEKEKLIEMIIKNALEIIQNPFGNYVVQALFNEHFEKEQNNCMKILDIINENFFSLSMQKFSSNVVENSLRLNSIDVLKKNLLNVVLSGKIGSMVKNTYGNFVIEKLIMKLSKEDKNEIKSIIETNGKDKTNNLVLSLLSD